MTTTSAVAPAAVPPTRTRWELPALGILAVLTFAMIPISIDTVPGGLPAHPLFIHVPVIFIPLATIGGLVLGGCAETPDRGSASRRSSPSGRWISP
jgi:hypothetical protein